MSDTLDKWEIFKTLSDELKRKIRLAVVFRGSAIYVTKDDEVFGFGKNEEGFLGTGDNLPRTEHTKIKQLCGQNIQELQFSECTFFAISASGSVFAWGNNEYGQLGLGTTQQTLIPTKIEGILGIKRVIQVACSYFHTLALTSDREVFSFGRNNFGQLGLGHKDEQTLPVKLDFPLPGTVVTVIACLCLSSIALLDSGEVLAWGKNEDGILALNADVNEQNVPRQVPGLEGITITRIVCGANHVLALSDDGKVYSWGWNRDGQLGNGRTDEYSRQPTLISGNFGRIRDVAAHFESCVSAAVTEADEVYIWGSFFGSSQNIMSPTETLIESLDEVFAKIPNRAMTFRTLRPKSDEMIEEKTANEWPDWLKKAFNRADTADVVFVVEGKKIHAHKAILIMQCAVFETMFQGDWKESNQREQIIEIRSYDAFFAFLKYFYTNEVDLQPDLALELFALAHFYQMSDLQKKCLKIIKQGVTVENAALVYDRAIQLATKELKEFVLNFSMEQMDAVVNSDGFKLLKDDVMRDFILCAAQQGVFKNDN
ncbi:Hypothetical predicted protein [Cloeon dipterum]|uniref:BTB domain-containing protein n=1 Tax=Cloeon dipterum TaxID=197152 RepID=A0A8S1DLC0_9INSE|nr:Hypothetical predicted protein [Cloeon dipterum]